MCNDHQIIYGCCAKLERTDRTRCMAIGTQYCYITYSSETIVDGECPECADVRERLERREDGVNRNGGGGNGRS